MTYYSDLLIVIDEIETLGYGRTPKRSASELRETCRRILAIEPNDDLAARLLMMLDDLPRNIRRESLWIYVVDRIKAMRATLQIGGRRIL